MNKNNIKKISKRKKEIIKSVRKLICTKGMNNLTIREIARDINITEGALYRHFTNKEEIISLLIDEINETLLDKIRIAAKNYNDPITKLKNIYISHLSYAEQRKGFSFIVIGEALKFQNKTMQKKVLTVIENYLIQIRAILQEAQKLRLLKNKLNLSSASIAFFGMIQSLITLWILSGHKSQFIMDNMNELFDIYINGLVNGKHS